jgi:anti-sigma regulatory factor (Ser/Thr protein kinase)
VESPQRLRRVWTLRGRPSCIGAGLQAEALAKEAGWPTREAGQICLLVIELCTNADRHGGGGRCVVELTSGECEVVVEDEGPGFPSSVLARVACGLSVEEAVARRGGRGLGAGLDSARRLSTRLSLENRAARGARAIARVVRTPTR